MAMPATRAPAGPTEREELRGERLLLLFPTGTFIVTALIILTADVGHLWVLAPVMALDLATAAVILRVVARLTADDGEPPDD
jgi:hypothetical protein